jgi:hypothetical protein
VSVPASTVVNIVRDIIPDAVYDSSGNPLPTTDGGIFRAQTLYRWINDGVKALAEQVGWIVRDWTAIAVTANQPNYALNGSWHEIDDAFQGGFRLMLGPESMTLWPKAIVGGQCQFFTQHRQTDHLEVGLFPVPNTTDPTSTLTPAITAANVTGFPIAANTNFLTYGYVGIDSEIIFYGALSGTTGLTVLQRGQCGTTAAAHTAGSTVTHLSGWFKGARMPLEVATGTDVVELPGGFIFALQEYVLAKCSYAQEDQATGKMHMDEFRKECSRIYADPNWRSDSQGMSAQPYGTPVMGRTIWGNVYTT